jgi:hypothetical protein
MIRDKRKKKQRKFMFVDDANVLRNRCFLCTNFKQKKFVFFFNANRNLTYCEF